MWMAWLERSGGWKVVEGEPLDSAAGFCAQEEEGKGGGALWFLRGSERDGKWDGTPQPTPHQRRRESGREVGLGRK